MQNNKLLPSLQQLPLIGIIRGIGEDALHGVLEAAIEGGLNTIEITMNTPRSEVLLRQAAERYGQTISIGAGTVVTVDDLARAVGSGAGFIVAPNYDARIASACREKAIPYFPGALTPTEIAAAWSGGAAMVKVFPVASLGGPQYIKELRGPFSDIKLLACGGVYPGNIGDYIKAGADCVAIGSQIFNREWMQGKQYDKVRDAAKMFVELTREAYL